MAKGLGGDTAVEVAEELDRLKWFLWHGNVFRSLQVVGDLEMDLHVEEGGPAQRKLRKTVVEFGGYIRANTSWIPNYGERYCAGEAISNAFVESAVNQVVSKRMVKKQQMRWTPKGAHLCSRSGHACSTTSWATPSDAGIRSSRPRARQRWWPDLPRIVPVSLTSSGHPVQLVDGRLHGVPRDSSMQRQALGQCQISLRTPIPY